MESGAHFVSKAPEQQTVLSPVCLPSDVAARDQILASFPGLHTQLLLFAVRKVGEGLDGFIT